MFHQWTRKSPESLLQHAAKTPAKTLPPKNLTTISKYIYTYIYVRKDEKMFIIWFFRNIPEPWICIGWLRSKIPAWVPQHSVEAENDAHEPSNSPLHPASFNEIITVTTSPPLWLPITHPERTGIFTYITCGWFLWEMLVNIYHSLDIFAPFITYDKLYRKIWSKLGAADY